VRRPYRLSPEALEDIGLLSEQLARSFDDKRAAIRRIAGLYEALHKIGETPGLGHRRPDLTDRPVLFWSVLGEYAVIYRPSDPVEIVRVLAWKRDLARLLAVGQGEA
jgi:plasmid stabilization system protein ParE